MLGLRNTTFWRVVSTQFYIMFLFIIANIIVIVLATTPRGGENGVMAFSCPRPSMLAVSLPRRLSFAPPLAASSSLSSIPHKLDAILFDCDGVLADTERDGHRISFNMAFASFDIDDVWDKERYGKLLAVGGGKERMTAHWVSHISYLYFFLPLLLHVAHCSASSLRYIYIYNIFTLQNVD